MGLVTCEVCNITMEGGWNLSQHLIGKAHLKKFARWTADHAQYQRVMPAEVVVMNCDLDDDDWEPVQVPVKALPQPLPNRQQATLQLRAPTTPTPTTTSTTSPYFPAQPQHRAPLPPAPKPLPPITPSPSTPRPTPSPQSPQRPSPRQALPPIVIPPGLASTSVARGFNAPILKPTVPVPGELRNSFYLYYVFPRFLIGLDQMFNLILFNLSRGLGSF